MKTYKKSVVLIPSAYNSKVMGDVENFIKYYKDDFSVYVIYDNVDKEEDGVTYLNKKNPMSNYLKLTADYIIDAGSINYKTRVMDSQKRVSVWHGIPYKKMFIDMDKTTVTDALDYDEGVDLMVSPCKFYTEEFLRKAMLYRGEILETAVSRTDSMYKLKKEKEEIKDLLNIPKDKKILLYAPTFRKEGKFKLPFDSKKVLEKLGDDWVIVTKLHYLNTLVPASNVIDCTNHSCVNDLLSICDLMITDYSSLFFDYSIVDKPVIFYQYDKENYKSDRGFMFDLEDYVDKKYIVYTEEDLLKIIDKTKDVKNLSKVKKTFYPYQKKDSTKGLVEKLNFNSENRKTKDIIFLVNELNEIGGVNNFIINLAKEFKSKYNSRIFVFAMRRHSSSNKDFYVFDKDNLIDIKLSSDMELDHIKTILKQTDGYIISCQFGAHRHFQKYLKGKNSILMFHGDVKDIIAKNIYTWHLKALNTKAIYNYKKLLLLSRGNALLLGKNVIRDVEDRIDYMENSYDFSNPKNSYKENGEFAFISRLDTDKNIFDSLEIFKDKNLNKNFKLHVYGDGKLRTEYEDRVKRNKLQDRVIVHGYCNDKDEMYKDKQGIILTSLTEGFPLTILEAVKYKIPVYLYNSFTSASEFANYSVIKLIKTSDIKEYVETLNNSTFDVKDFDKIIDRFSNDSIVERWIDLFDEVEGAKNLENHSLKMKLKEKIKGVLSIKGKVVKTGKKFAKDHFYLFAKRNTKIVYNARMRLNYFKYKVKHLSKKTKQPLVSLVVPFYNNNATINALLKSIKKCGYKNYEILLINDGSKEDPKKFYSKYKRVKYFYKENGGLGMVRNYGIDHAKGKYIFFIDSDDTMCKGALNYLVDYAEKHKLDVVSGRCRRIFYGTNKLVMWYPKLFKKSYVNTPEKRLDILKDTISTAKLYNLEALKKSNIRFETGLYEDILFMAKIYKYFDNIGIVNRDVYNWLVYGNNSSITTSYNYNQMKERVDRMNKIFDLTLDKYKSFYVTHAVNHDMFILVKYYLSYQEEDREKVFKLFRSYFMDKQKYVYLKDVVLPHKKEAYKCMIDNDFEKFNTIALCFSYKDAKDNGFDIEE